MSERDKLLALILPGLATAVLYVMIAGKSAEEALATAQKELVAARASTVLPAQIDAERETQIKLSAETMSHKDQQKRFEQRLVELANQVGKGASRAEKVERLSRILKRHGLAMVEESPEDDSSGSTKLPPSLSKVNKRITAKGENEQVRLWRVHFVGPYADALAALQEVAEIDSLGVPLSLEMRETDATTRVRSWTLLIWI